ncbi:CASTOR/POLLUX-related putative ion channel [Microcella sp.]|uniref:CASTOR/POLLUX-related putative ion channel n=1 Tax=Microcella sp. TaxID=1913979 RepID=UPI00299F65E9|nr:hypothetical protein [Microcella sp.]MDX2025629.1 hypothetical protein [Microcella sp.]
MSRPTLPERFRYWFDSVMARGTVSLMGLLALASGAFILAITGVVVAFQLYPTRLPDGFSSLEPEEILWGSLVRVLSAGSFREDEGWGFRVAMLVVTIAGLILVASLIGIVSSAFDRRLLELRKGRSRVLETGHTVILGWSSKVIPIVAELQLAQRNGRRSPFVILSPRDKVEVEDELRARIGRQRGSHIIVRSGDPMDPTDLAMVSPEAARSIIVISPDTAFEPDIEVIKTVLALNRAVQNIDIIGELRSTSNLEAARLAGSASVRWVIGDELIGRLTLHSVRHDGISVVSRDLLDFDGDEFYVTRRAELAGVTYAEAQRRFEFATLVGVVRDGHVNLNPVSSLSLHEDDELVLIAPDERGLGTGPAQPVDSSLIDITHQRREAPSRTLVLGQHSGMQSLVTSLHAYFPPGSSAHLVSSEAREVTEPVAQVTTQLADTTSRAVLDSLDIPSFDHVVVVPYKDSLPTHSADARTLVTLLHLRDIRRASGAHFSVVTEMLDDRNTEIADADSADDVIVSDLLVSRLLAQVSRTPRLVDVFDRLFGHEGSETHLRPVEQYCPTTVPVSVATLIEAASRRGETFMGYRVAARIHERPDFGVVINPRTSSSVTFAAGDRLIVLADR